MERLPTNKHKKHKELRMTNLCHQKHTQVKQYIYIIKDMKTTVHRHFALCFRSALFKRNDDTKLFSIKRILHSLPFHINLYETSF